MESHQIDLLANSALPLYKQLEEVILQEIARLSDGDMLPAERELQEKYHVSRATVRATLEEIERLGRIKRVQGVGTIVTKPKIQPEIMKLTSFSEDVRSRGLTPGSRTLDLQIIRSTQPIVDALNIDLDTELLYVKRLMLVDEEPVGIHELHIPPSLELSLNELRSLSSYYDLLRKRHNIEPTFAHERLTAIDASSDIARLLDIAPGSALLSIERTTYAADSSPIEFVNLVYRGDRYEYQVSLYRDRE